MRNPEERWPRRVQFPDTYPPGQTVATASGAVTLDDDRCALLSEADYLALQWNGVAIRMAAPTQGRDNARAQVEAMRQAAALTGGADGPGGGGDYKSKWLNAAKAER